MKPTKLNKEIVNLLLPRIEDELVASIFYRNASNYLKGCGYNLAAKYFAGESADELTHSKGLEDYLIDWNVEFDLPTIEEQDNAFKGLYDVIEKAYKLELALYKSYEDTTSEVLATGDMCTFFFLAKYNEIQRTSVSQYSDFINMIDGCDESSKFELLMLEEKLFGE
jgi:ferritin